MSERYVVKPLGTGQYLQAYPLVRTAAPQLSPAQWLGYIEELCGGRHRDDGAAGIMSAQNPDGYIYGIYCHAAETDIKHGRVLKVSNLVTANLYDPAGIMGRMIESMADKAREVDCVAVHIELPEEDGRGPQPPHGAASMLRGAGYRLASVALCRPVDKK